MTITIFDLSDDAMTAVFEQLTALKLRCAARACRRWLGLIPRAHLQLSCLVTSAGSNEVILFDARGRVVQRIRAAPPDAARRRGAGRRRSSRHLRDDSNDWPTCIAQGAGGSLYLSQYGTRGVLQFARCLDGYHYQRSVARGFSSPEGVVVANDSIYLISVDRGSITRLSHDGRKLDESAQADHHGQFFVYWGMCMGPDGNLYVAAHVADDGDFLVPTAHDTGGVLRQVLRADGSFGSAAFCCGYPPSDLSGTPHWRCFNRPSDPAFCEHGALHVTSFVCPTTPERAVFKINVLESKVLYSINQGVQPPWGELYMGQCIARLVPTNSDGHQLLREAWGLSFAPGEALVCCQSAAADGGGAPHLAPLVRLEGCGCGDIERARLQAVEQGDAELPRLRCGTATVLAGASAGIQHANYVTHVEN